MRVCVCVCVCVCVVQIVACITGMGTKQPLLVGGQLPSCVVCVCVVCESVSS